MIAIIDNKELGFDFSFNSRNQDLIQSLIDLFIEKKTLDCFNDFSLIIVTHLDFFYVIKNIYGNLESGVLLSNIAIIINKHINI